MTTPWDDEPRDDEPLEGDEIKDDETQEYELGHLDEETAEHPGPEPDAGAEQPEAGAEKPEAGAEQPEAGAEEPDAEAEEPDAEAEEPEGEDADEEPGSELEDIINAETQEWDGVAGEHDDADADGEPGAEHHPTVVASARSKVTSGFEAVGGKKITSGFKAVRRRLRFPLWARFLTGSFVIVVAVGAATASSLVLYLEDIGNRLKHGNTLEGVTDKLAGVEGGDPQTIMILGSDKDPELKDVQKGFKGLSDTTMLLRIDPDRNAIALFSLPRDLRVEIPGVGTDKLNAAYAYGGPELTLQTVQELTKSPELPNGLEVNHLVNVDFEGFARAVNEIDCVYVDVDRRYYNSNEGKAAALTYEEIDLQPGYQALCGFDALDYARYRHTDNDVVRAARQQDFLREARQKVPPEVVFARRKELIDIFVEHTTSDIDSAQEMLEVLKLFVEARNAPLKEVHFEGTLGPSFVTATQGEIDKAVNQFLGIEDTPGARASTAAPENPAAVGQPEQPPDQVGVTPAPAAPRKEKGEAAESDLLDDQSNLTRTSYGKELAKGIRARDVKLPIYYPTLLETGSDYAQKPRVYKINGTGEGSPPNGERAAYKWVFSRPMLGEYYGLMATRWMNPPLLKNPSEEREIDGRTYKLFYDGDRLRIVAWQTGQGSFWVSNTLIQSLSDREMIEIAKGMAELPRAGRR
jgi:LCP family protein required for cell wall assembly